jgi:anhydro-N-acetylmuramic acid kinase
MSGTSLDGIDVAIVDMRRTSSIPRIQPVAFHSTPYPRGVREALLGVSNQMTHTATISRLNFLLGELYAEAVRETCRRKRVPLDSISLLGMHGQTIFHEGAAAEYLGRSVANTLQIGEAAIVAERTGLWTISGFRERDIAAGGKGAPLVPAVDYFLFRNRRIGRVALNIGGIANITVLPAGVTRDDVVAFDTGPGNLVIDALVSHHTHGRETYDRGGAIAQRGTVHARLLESMLADRYFALPPPKTSGREQFGQEFVSGLIATGLSIENLIATATELTAQTIARAIVAYPDIREVIASGGGVRNRHLMRRLRALLPRHELKTSAEFGIDPDAKEAIAFAVLAYEFVEGRPGNLPSATGARRAVLLGKGTPVS